ncbi:MAG: hypothetical protein KF878_20835 [Planctomycetes bacterium]|nr:hypothetical protein [Planctomycetota bacterium]
MFGPALTTAIAVGLSGTAAACGGGGSSGGGVAMAPATAAPSTPGVPAGAPASPPGTSQPGTTPISWEPAPAGGARLGTNLGYVTHYMPDWPFVDVFKTSQVNSDGFPWKVVNPKGAKNPALDAEGYPRGLAAGQAVTAICMSGGRYPGGVYTLLFDGDGEVHLSLDAEATRASHDGRGTFSRPVTVKPTSSGIQVRIVRSNPANHVRNIRLIMPGFDERTTFHPLFLDRLRPFAVLRFLNWGRVNRSKISKWSQRTPAGYRTQSHEPGVAYEYMVQLCNTLGKDPWICVPHLADDDYVRRLATLLRDTLDPRLKVHIEYSNEVWNGIFSQSGHVKREADKNKRSFVQQYVARSVEIFRIFEQTFGGTQRLVRVISGQSNNAGIAKQAVAALPAGAADALAIAPYFGGHLGNSKNWQATRGLTVDRLIDACAQDIQTRRAEVRNHLAMARSAGLQLVAYEGGQHLAGVGNAANDERLVNLLIAANRHPRMAQVYRDYLAMWRTEANSLFCHYSFVYAPKKHGSWGALEHMAQTGAPKYDALVEAARVWHGR